jgi:hypothetical protein
VWLVGVNFFIDGCGIMCDCACVDWKGGFHTMEIECEIVYNKN